MSQSFILRITPGGKNIGTDRTLWSRENGKISIGWSYLKGLHQVPDHELKSKITLQESVYNDNQNHINHIYNMFQKFIHEMKIGDIVLIPQPSTNGHDGTNLYIVKVLSEIKYNEEYDHLGCSYYRDAEWCPHVIKWRTSPYNAIHKSDISLDLMHYMWKPEILRKTLTGPNPEFNSEFETLYQQYKN